MVNESGGQRDTLQRIILFRSGGEGNGLRPLLNARMANPFSLTVTGRKTSGEETADEQGWGWQRRERGVGLGWTWERWELRSENAAWAENGPQASLMPGRVRN